MLAISSRKKALIAMLMLGLSIIPADAKGLKFHIGKIKIEIGNKNLITVIPPHDTGQFITSVVGLGLPNSPKFNPVYLDPNIIVAVVLFDGMRDWLSAPKNILGSIDGTRNDFNKWAEKFYALLSSLINDIRYLVSTYGILIFLGMAVTIIFSFVAGAYVLGKQIRKGLTANQHSAGAS